MFIVPYYDPRVFVENSEMLHPGIWRDHGFRCHRIRSEARKGHKSKIPVTQGESPKVSQNILRNLNNRTSGRLWFIIHTHTHSVIFVRCNWKFTWTRRAAGYQWKIVAFQFRQLKITRDNNGPLKRYWIEKIGAHWNHAGREWNLHFFTPCVCVCVCVCVYLFPSLWVLCIKPPLNIVVVKQNNGSQWDTHDLK